jgi:galactoside O-acetyltransferase
MLNGWLSKEEIENIGFQDVGSNIRISRAVSIYGAEKMKLGSDVRIDDFCLLSGRVVLGDHVHISSHVSLNGRYGITCGDFSSISTKVAVLSGNDDNSGSFLTNPTVPEEFTNVDGREVVIGRHCLVGAGTVILPGVHLGDGVCVGALSLVKKDLEPWKIYAGVPCRMLKERSMRLLQLERELRALEASER